MNNIKLFESKQIRSVWNEAEQQWYFSILDVVAALSETTNARRYWSDLKRKLKKEGFFQLYEIIVQLKMESSDGKFYNTDAANTESLLRVIQTIPSPKAEPFKQWLAKVGAERIAEIEDPELAQKRIRETYRAKGYSDDWIEKRVRGIATRDELTEEWKKRGIEEGREYAILTAEISKATFGLTPSQYKNLKNLPKPTDNLRDHMNDLELIFTMLGEASTTKIARNKDAQGFDENQKAARAGGTVAGDARKALEQQLNESVITPENFKQLTNK